MNNPNFENTLVKIQEKDEKNISLNEKLAASALYVGSSVEATEGSNSNSNSIVGRANERLRSERNEMKSANINT